MTVIHDNTQINVAGNNVSDTVSHVLASNAVKNRILIVTCYGHSFQNTPTTYNGVAPILFNSYHVSGYSYIQHYYLLDSQLPAAGGTYTISTTKGGYGYGISVSSFYNVVQEPPTILTNFVPAGNTNFNTYLDVAKYSSGMIHFQLGVSDEGTPANKGAVTSSTAAISATDNYSFTVGANSINRGTSLGTFAQPALPISPNNSFQLNAVAGNTVVTFMLLKSASYGNFFPFF